MRKVVVLFVLTPIIISACSSPLSDHEVVQNYFNNELKKIIGEAEQSGGSDYLVFGPGNKVAANIRDGMNKPETKQCLYEVEQKIAPYHLGRIGEKFSKDASSLTDGENRALRQGTDVLDSEVHVCILRIEAPGSFG